MSNSEIKQKKKTGMVSARHAAVGVLGESLTATTRKLITQLPGAPSSAHVEVSLPLNRPLNRQLRSITTALRAVFLYCLWLSLLLEALERTFFSLRDQTA